MTSTNNFRKIASSLTLLSIMLGITLTYATTENNYKTSNNFLSNIFETTLTENGYKTNIVLNPDVIGIYAKENGYKLDLAINTQGIGGSHKENNYRLDLIPEKTFPEVSSDVAVTKITPYKTIVGQGYSVYINVTASNQALDYVTFNVTIYGNNTTIQTQTITLASKSSMTTTFTWNTASFAKANYSSWAYAWPVQGETEISNNMLADSWVLVSIPGDINGDRKVDGKDFVLVIKALPSLPGQAKWNPNADINNDIKVDAKDYVLVIGHIGQSW